MILSRRNLFTMLTMFAIVLVLFVSTPVLKEYFNDYDVNHAAQEESIERTPVRFFANAQQHVVYAGPADSDYYEILREWSGYRKRTFHKAPDVQTGIEWADGYEMEKTLFLLDGSALAEDPQQDAQALTDYVQKGGTVIFLKLPSYQTIGQCDTLRQLLGIQKLRAESVELLEIWLYKGFLLGGDECYAFDQWQDPKRIDIGRVIPWYDISSRTKTYMVGYIPIADREAMGLSREDMPAMIWRSSAGTGSVFALNGDFFYSETLLGILDAMVYESQPYALYAVVNAQNLSVAGFPDLTVENEEKMSQVYVFDTVQFCRDILWPSLVAAANTADWKISAFLSVKQSGDSEKEPDMASVIEYLKYYNEVSAEAGIAMGRMQDASISRSMQEEKEKLNSLGLDYAFTAGYIRSENLAQLPGLRRPDGSLRIYPELRTVVTPRDGEQKVLSWMTNRVTRQRITVDGFQHTYQDNLRLKSLQTALGYSNVQADIYRVLWLENSEDAWEQVAEKFSSNISTFWKPFAAFDKTTITESDRRVRLFLNETVTSALSVTEQGRQIHVQVDNFNQEAWLMLRTHGEEIAAMEGGDWKQIEDDAYLLHLTSDTAAITLKSGIETYYYEGT